MTVKLVKEETSKEHKALWVCAGKRLAADEKSLVQTWYPLDKDGVPDLNDSKSFGKKGLSATARPGGVYEMTFEKVPREDGSGFGISVFTGGPKAPAYQHVLDDEKQIAAWRVEEDSDTARVRLAKKESAELSVDMLQKCLEPIQNAYLKTDRVGRRLIMATVMSYIADGRRLKP